MTRDRERASPTDEGSHLGVPLDLHGLRVPVEVRIETRNPILPTARIVRPGEQSVRRDRFDEEPMLAFRFATQPKVRKPGWSFLEEFITLRNRSFDDVVEFARAWGPLGTCERGAPLHGSAHDPCDGLGVIPGYAREVSWESVVVAAVQPQAALFPSQSCRPHGFRRRDEVSEPLEAWFAYSEAAWDAYQLIMPATEALAGRFPYPDAESGWLVRPNVVPDESDRQASSRYQQLRLALSWWGHIGQVHPSTVNIAGRLTVKERTPGVLGAIALTLQFATSGLQGFARCMECGNQSKMKKAPPPDKPNYCPPCRGKVGARNRRRVSRARKKAEGEKKTAQ